MRNAGLTVGERAHCRVKLPVFEGPFDLLYHLIEAEEIDIWDIPIASVAEQYLAYLTAWREMDLEIAGEFLVMAARLLAIKARLLLPDPAEEEEGEEGDEGIDPREQLARQLLMYRRFKIAAGRLERLAAARAGIRGRRPAPVVDVNRGRLEPGAGDPHELAALYSRLLRAKRERESSALHIASREYTLEERIEQIAALLRQGGKTSFVSLLPGPLTRRNIVITFLAVLELVRLGLAQALQDEPFGPLMLEAAPHARTGA